MEYQQTIKELNENREEAIIKLKEVHHELSLLTTFGELHYNVYDSDLYEVNYFNALTKRKWGNKLLSENTFLKLAMFHENWKLYRLHNSYADDPFFVFLDYKWNKIVQVYLIPLLAEIENDFIRNDVGFITYTTIYDPEVKPTAKEIVERVRILYDLLIKHKIIERHYLD